MEKAALSNKGREKPSEFVTVGDVKLPVKVWERVNSYKNNQRVKGRKMRMPEVSVELIEKGLISEGI